MHGTCLWTFTTLWTSCFRMKWTTSFICYVLFIYLQWKKSKSSTLSSCLRLFISKCLLSVYDSRNTAQHRLMPHDHQKATSKLALGQYCKDIISLPYSPTLGPIRWIFVARHHLHSSTSKFLVVCMLSLNRWHFAIQLSCPSWLGSKFTAPFVWFPYSWRHPQPYVGVFMIHLRIMGGLWYVGP